MILDELFSILLFFVTLGVLLLGFPVAFSLAGTAILFALIGVFFGHFDTAFLSALPERIFGIMMNETLIAVPLFVFMGMVLERSKISEDLLETMAELFGSVRGGLGISVCLVGGLLAASTGIVGATVVTMGLISLPTMLKRNYPPSLSSGIVCASGTLGQIIPPSIVLIILADVISSANQQAQLSLGNFSPDTISVGDLFAGAMIPGILLMVLYIGYIVALGMIYPNRVPVSKGNQGRSGRLGRVLKALLPPLILIVGVLGSIMMGAATPTEAASVGSIGAIALAKMKRNLSLSDLRHVMLQTTKVTSMVFTILIGAGIFSLVFRGYGGDHLVQTFLENHSGGPVFSFFIVMLVIFILGFFLDFFEITFVVIPIVGPSLLSMGMDPVWLGVLIALNLQTSFLTPPFGFSLFYLRGVASTEVKTSDIYRGVFPFIGIQLILILLIYFVPALATWLPGRS